MADGVPVCRFCLFSLQILRSPVLYSSSRGPASLQALCIQDQVAANRVCTFEQRVPKSSAKQTQQAQKFPSPVHRFYCQAK